MPTDELQKWIEANAIPVRSIDPMEDDLSDLEPLIDAIGGARVVQLGESSHGSGSDFKAKVRLIKFLNQRMGFDVLVWESGLNAMRQVNAGLRSGQDPVTAAQRGVFTIWSATEEVKPLFDYAKASQAGPRPLEMAGFDSQFTAPGADQTLAADLRTFVQSLRDSNLRRLTEADVEAAIAKYASIAARGSTAADLQAMEQAIDRLLATIDRERPGFEQMHGAQEISFIERSLENLRVFGALMFDAVQQPRGTVTASFKDTTGFFNRRDAQNARNLRWLVEERYPGRKLIVWAHNVHVMNASLEPAFQGVHVEPRPGDMKPMGVHVADWLGTKVYTIALTTYQGSDGWVTSKAVTQVPRAAEGSLEARLHAFGKPYLFLDFRTLGANTEHPLRKPQLMRVLIPVAGTDTAGPANGNYTIDDVAQVFDAVFFIDRTTPATRISSSRGVSK